MTNKDIKKALECCSNSRLSSCNNCPYNNNSKFSCRDGEMCKDALNLITEQEQEIERLKDEFKQLETNAEILARGVRDLNHENYELTEKIKQLKTECTLLDDELRNARQETINVLNKLKAKSYVNDYCREVVEVEKIDKMIEELIKNAED